MSNQTLTTPKSCVPPLPSIFCRQAEQTVRQRFGGWLGIHIFLSVDCKVSTYTKKTEWRTSPCSVSCVPTQQWGPTLDLEAWQLVRYMLETR